MGISIMESLYKTWLFRLIPYTVLALHFELLNRFWKDYMDDELVGRVEKILEKYIAS